MASQFQAGADTLANATAGVINTENAGLNVDPWMVYGFGNKLSWNLDESSRLTNLTWDAQTWGKFAPITWGTCRIEGSMVWSTPFVERQVVKSWQSGYPNDTSRRPKFQINTEYQYTISGAWSFGYNGSPGKRRYLSRLYMNKAIVYDRAGGYTYPGLSFSFQEGTLEQLPAAAYVKDKGVEAVAFRGQMVVFVENLPIKDFGAALPSVWAEIVEEDDIMPEAEAFDVTISDVSIGGAQNRHMMIDWVRRRVYQLIRTGNSSGPDNILAVYELDGQTQIAEFNIEITDNVITPPQFIPWMGIMIVNDSLNGELLVIDVNTGLTLSTIANDGMNFSIDIKTTPTLEDGGAWVAALNLFKTRIEIARLSEEGAVSGISSNVVEPPEGYAFGGNLAGHGSIPVFYYDIVETGVGLRSIGLYDCEIGGVSFDAYIIPSDLQPTHGVQKLLMWNDLLIVCLTSTTHDEAIIAYDTATVDGDIAWRIQPTISQLYPSNASEMSSSNTENGRITWSTGTDVITLDLMSGTLTIRDINGIPERAMFDGNEALYGISGGPAKYYVTAPPNGMIRLDRWMSDCLRLAGYDDSQFAIINVNDTIEGAFINQPYNIIQMLDDVAALHRITRTESDGKLIYEKKVPDEGMVEPELSIDYSELAWLNQGDDSRSAISMRMAAESETPTEVTTQFINPELSYADDTYTYRRPAVVSASKQAMTLRVPLMMTKSRVAFLSQGILYDVWGGQLTGSIRLPRSFYDIDEGTIINLTHGSFSDIVRLLEVTHNADWSVSASFELVRAKRVGRGVVDPYNPPQVTPIGRPDSQLYLFDVPLLSPDDAVDDKIIIYMAIAGIGQPYWPGGYIAKAGEEAGGYSSIVQQKDAGIIGKATNALGGSLSNADGLRVFFGGTNPFEGRNATTEELGEPGRNMAFYGKNGRWEVIQWQTATLDAQGFVVFDGVRRGLRGTSAAGHQPGDSFVNIGSNIRAVAFPISALATTLLFKPVGYGMPIDRAPTYAYTVEAVALRPWSPIIRRIADLDGGDITVSWYRRDRLGFNTLGTADPLPLSDPPEEYELELLDGAGAVLRTAVGLTTPAWTYTAADQAADGVVGTPASLRVRVYQISATLGRGLPGEDVTYV